MAKNDPLDLDDLLDPNFVPKTPPKKVTAPPPVRRRKEIPNEKELDEMCRAFATRLGYTDEKRIPLKHVTYFWTVWTCSVCQREFESPSFYKSSAFIAEFRKAKNRKGGTTTFTPAHPAHVALTEAEVRTEFKTIDGCRHCLGRHADEGRPVLPMIPYMNGNLVDETWLGMSVGEDVIRFLEGGGS